MARHITIRRSYRNNASRRFARRRVDDGRGWRDETVMLYLFGWLG